MPASIVHRPGARGVLRLAAGFLALLVVLSMLLFAAVSVLPGDPVSQALGPLNSPERAAALRSALGFDASPVVRYWHWVIGLLHGDLGRSAVSQRPVGPAVGAAAGHSLVLALIALVGIALAGVAAGLIAGVRPGSRTDRAISAVTVTLTAVPEFALATVLIAVFAIGLGVLPAVSLIPAGAAVLDDPQILVLPAASLVLYGGAYATRMIRSVVADVAEGPSVENARIAGLTEAVVLRRHVLPMVLGPIAQVLALLVPYVVGGALVVETVFAYPGLGSLLSSSIANRDAVLTADCGMILATVAVIGFFLAEAVHRRTATAPSGRSGPVATDARQVETTRDGDDPSATAATAAGMPATASGDLIERVR